MRRKRSRKNESVPGQLPLAASAFRLAALSGSMPAPEAGVNNIPPDSQDYECVPLCNPGIDYLSCMYTIGGDLDRELELWEELLCVGFDRSRRIIDEKPWGTWSRVSGSFGVSFEYRYTPDHKCLVRVSGGGQVFSHLDENKHRQVFNHLLSREDHRVTRLDLKLDDRMNHLDLSSIELALSEGNYSGYNCGEVITSHGGARPGKTIYFGGRKSDQRLRFYDKGAESGEGGSWTRQELQTRGKRANELYHYILREETGSLWQRVLDRVTSSITFGLRKGKNLSRIVVAEFWTKWLSFVGGQLVPKPRIPRFTGIERTLDWMARSVAKAMARAKQALSPEGFDCFLSALVLKGDKHVMEKEWTEIAFFRSQGGEERILERLLCGNIGG